MPVTINDMQVETQERTPAPVSAQAQPVRQQPRTNVRAELAMLAERQLRLKGD